MAVIEQRLENESSTWTTTRIAILLVLVAVSAAIAGYFISDMQTPGPTSADVGFTRDMSEHHRQAVEMSRLLYDRSDDDVLRTVAYDIMITQQGQIGIMTGYLSTWGHPIADLGPRMEWMGMSVDGLMPGMATREEMNTLAAADGREAEIIFLQLMIPHHVSGVEMAEAAAEQAQTEIVRNLAHSMADAQQSEIDYMQDLLVERGEEPVTVDAVMDHGDH